MSSIFLRLAALYSSQLPVDSPENALASNLPVPSGIKTVWLPAGEEYAHGSTPTPSAPTHKEDPELPVLFPVVASGGTFDHLHAGHKILLSMGTWIAQHKLIVGITGSCTSFVPCATGTYPRIQTHGRALLASCSLFPAACPFPSLPRHFQPPEAQL